MADRRCLRKEILFSDKFLSMPAKVCLLYILLNFIADDDGFADSPGLALLSSHCTKKDLMMLDEKGYIFQFDSGIVLIRHWFVHNTIKGDRYHPTMHTDELNLVEKDRNKVYQWKKERRPEYDSPGITRFHPQPPAADDGALNF